jgi:arginyl-tRNA synthetase
LKEDIQNLLFEEIKSSNLKGVTKASQIEVFEPKNIEFGDWTSNICMKLAANSEDNPRQIAEKLIRNLTKNDWITKIEIAGAGFLNFYLTAQLQGLMNAQQSLHRLTSAFSNKPNMEKVNGMAQKLGIPMTPELM